MRRTALIGHPGVSWRDWIKSNRGKSDLLCLDPADVVTAHPGKFTLLRGEKVLYQRFFGSADLQKAPHVWLGALNEALSKTDADVIVQFPLYRPTPVAWQAVLLGLQLFLPTDILVAEGTMVDLNAFPIGPELVALDKAFPAMVQQAQRKAQWMALRERCKLHEIDLRNVSIEGARLGSGRRLDPVERGRLTLEDCLVEVTGTNLMIISHQEIDERVVARALDFTHCSKAHLVDPHWFEGLISAFARQSGEDFGYGFVESFDFENLKMTAWNTAEPPTPVRILRLGSLRVDLRGNELPELKPWQV